jgi:hypothetical protein
MRKISKARPSNVDRHAVDTDLREARPHRIPGATITSWPGSVEIDLDSLFARPVTGTTIAGAVSVDVTRSRASVTDKSGGGTVSLSDGTQITFATTDQFDTIDSL